jgi:hypothetical protein
LYKKKILISKWPKKSIWQIFCTRIQDFLKSVGGKLWNNKQLGAKATSSKAFQKSLQPTPVSSSQSGWMKCSNFEICYTTCIVLLLNICGQSWKSKWRLYSRWRWKCLYFTPNIFKNDTFAYFCPFFAPFFVPKLNFYEKLFSWNLKMAEKFKMKDDIFQKEIKIFL